MKLISKGDHSLNATVIDNTTKGPKGVPFMSLLVAVHGLRALNKGMRLTRFATPKRCMEIVSQATGIKYKRTDRNKALRDGEALLDSIRQSKEAI